MYYKTRCPRAKERPEPAREMLDMQFADEDLEECFAQRSPDEPRCAAQTDVRARSRTPRTLH